MKTAIFLDTQKREKNFFAVNLEIINIKGKGDIESFSGNNKIKQKPKEYILEDKEIDFS